MRRIDIIRIIKEEILYFIDERTRNGMPAVNLHGEGTQLQFVINLAKKNPMGLISISDIALALNTTNDQIYNNYSRLIRHYSDKENKFVKVIPEVPRQHAAVYQLIDYRDSGLDKSKMSEVEAEEREKYTVLSMIKKNGGNVFYAFYPTSGRDDGHATTYFRAPWEMSREEIEKHLPPNTKISEKPRYKEPSWGTEVKLQGMSK